MKNVVHAQTLEIRDNDEQNITRKHFKKLSLNQERFDAGKLTKGSLLTSMASNVGLPISEVMIALRSLDCLRSQT